VKLPVPPERLKERFPSLTDDDLEAYREVTERLLGETRRGKALSDIMAAGQRAREKEGEGRALDEAESLALRYLRAMEKMQG
jgi:hypothetical protein